MPIDYSVLAQPKGRTRKQLKGRKQRAEAAVKRSVRAACVERDGHCRFWTVMPMEFEAPHTLTTVDCDGESQWAHMHVKRRAQTRGQVPEVRHTTEASLMLCRVHHDQYDGRQSPRLYITALSRNGANGALKFRRQK